jgi:signal peptidase II
MNSERSYSSLLRLSLIIIFTALFLDQALKIWIKTHMMIGQEIHVVKNWFIIHFTENNGMAFGMQFGGESGKIILTIFRIIAAGLIFWYLVTLINKKAHKGLIFTISLIFAGAVGNIIDSAFYGMLFSESNFNIAGFLPKEGVYGSFLHGKVVDMLYFPMIEGHFPSWFPVWKNEEFIFFRPVFNIADSCISVGVFTLIIFQKRFFPKNEEPNKQITND